MNAPAVTMLSYGIGQDSWTILVKLALDPEFRQRYAPGHLVVVASDTGNEHPDTYLHNEYTKAFCKLHGIEYLHLTRDKGYHSEGWQTLQFYFSSKNNIMSTAYSKACTDRLKIEPLYRWLEEYVAARFGYRPGRKGAIKSYAAEHGKLRVLIGIAKGEEARLGGEDAKVWMRNCIDKVYPLIDVGMDRAACQAYLIDIGEPVPPPSNCVFCPFKSKAEVLWTYRFLPEAFQEWVEHEARKIAHWATRVSPERNLGVKGRKLLPQVLSEAKELYGHLSDAKLNELRMSHGHACSSRY